MTTAGERLDGRSVQEVLAWSRSLLDPALHAAVATLPDAVQLIAGYHFGWCDVRGRPTTAPAGKALRPALTLLAAEAVGGPPDAALPAAVAVELVHSFSLLHDDVMDGDVTRHHRPAVWCAFGTGAAILAGDSLLTLAMELLAEQPGPLRTLSAAVQALLAGQLADLAFERRRQVTLAECVRMVEDKTAALLGCACELGAVLGGGDPGQARALRDFGTRLGLAFQHVDDLLGIWGDPSVTGKPVHSDLRSRKKSLPVVVALESNTPAGRELAARYLTGTEPSGPDLAHIADLIEQTGARTWTRTQADTLLAEALHLLHSAKPDDRAATDLATLARYIINRDH